MHRALVIATIAAAAALTEVPPMAHPLTEADAFTAAVEVPDDGDDRNAASVEPAFQSLANRTRHLLNRFASLLESENEWTGWQRFHGGFTSRVGLGLVGATNEVMYTDDAGAVTPRLRLTYLPIAACAHDGGWRIDQVAPTAYADEAEVYLRVPVDLPTGAVLQRIEVGVLTGGTMSIRVEKLGVSGNVASQVFLAQDTVTAPGVVLGVDVAQAVDSASGFFSVRIRAAATPTPFAGGYGTVNWIRLLWLDPGPRNF